MGMIQLPKFAHPDFTEPGIKPVGPINVDYTEALSQYLENIFVNRGPSVVNLGRGDWKFTVGSGTSYTNSTIHGPLFNPPSDSTISTSFVPVAPPFTLYTRCFRLGNHNGSPNRVFGYSSTAGDELNIQVGAYNHQVVARYNYGSIMQLSLDGGVNPGIKETLVNDLFMVCAADGDWTGYLYVNGHLQDSNTNATTVGGFSTYNRMQFGHAHASIPIPVEVGMHFSKALSQQETALIVRNPYQVLKPAIPLEAFYSTTAASTLKTLQLPKLFHPDFTAPGVKPVGQVEIDWANPLSHDLTFVYPGDQRNLVDNKVPSSGYTNTNFVVTEKGKTYNYSGSATQGFDPIHTGGFNGSKISILAIFKPSSSAKDHAILDINNQQFIFWVDNVSGNLRTATYAGGSPNYGASGEVVKNAWNIISCSASLSSTTHSTNYANGTLSASDSDIGGSNWVSNTNIRIADNYSLSGKEMSGDLAFIVGWSRKLSEAEHISLHHDPFQILKPAIPLEAFYGSAAAGSSFQSAWARNANQIIQVGI